jgi:hypothetical protein
MKTAASCETCRFVYTEPVAPDVEAEEGASPAADNTHYECHRYPPNLTSDERDEWVWPIVGPHDFCGEWRAALPARRKDLSAVRGSTSGG